jgi:hypothetical protein
MKVIVMVTMMTVMVVVMMQSNFLEFLYSVASGNPRTRQYN